MTNYSTAASAVYEIAATNAAHSLFQVTRHSSATAPNVVTSGDAVFITHGQYEGYLTNQLLPAYHADDDVSYVMIMIALSSAVMYQHELKRHKLLYCHHQMLHISGPYRHQTWLNMKKIAWVNTGI